MASEPGALAGAGVAAFEEERRPRRFGALRDLLHKKVAMIAIVYLLVGYGAQAILSTRPLAARRVSQLSGAAMIAIAMLLFVDQVIP